MSLTAVRRVAGIILAAATVLVPVSWAPTAPTPSRIPRSWQLKIRMKNPKAITVKVPGRDEPERFWYIRYVVVNQTGEDQTFIPEFVLYTDTGEIIRAGRKVPGVVFQKIKSMYNDPLLRDAAGMTGKLLQGEDNAKRGVAIFHDFDPKAGGFDVFVGGLSGESVKTTLPNKIETISYDELGRPVKVQTDVVTLSKTLHLRYDIPGEAANRPEAGPILRRIEWVMR